MDLFPLAIKPVSISDFRSELNVPIWIRINCVSDRGVNGIRIIRITRELKKQNKLMIKYGSNAKIISLMYSQ